MSNKVQIAIVGSGPGGMSAAAHAAELDVPHVLLEKTDKHSDTIQKYQKGKHVMATPDILPLRSPLEFAAGKREFILDTWEEGLKQHNTNIAFNGEVSKIEGQKGDFKLTTARGDVWEAEAIILGIGVQGNPRKLGVDGQEHERVQYQLDDPDEYKGETIVIVGAGDAAIENAVALAVNNTVYIVNRRDEFARAKEGNLNLISAAIGDGSIECFYSSSPARVDATPDADTPINFILTTADGEATVPCHRIIARLGAIPQRALVESFGIEFPNDSPAAIPELTSQYESNVPGLYVVGALGGYPLIKQAMNQGYEVVEYILGNEIQPADHPILAERFASLPFDLEVDEILAMMQERIPLFSGVNSLLFRELMLESTVHTPQPGQPVFRINDYGNTFFSVLNGHVNVHLGSDRRAKLETGKFFGEMGLLSGRRRNATVYAEEDCVLIETNRRSMVKLINSNEAVKRVLDETFILRALQTSLAPTLTVAQLEDIAHAAGLSEYKPGEVIMQAGEASETFHFIRSGSVQVEKQVEDETIVLAYIPANNYLGEISLLGNTAHTATVTANVQTETITLDKATFFTLLDRCPELQASMRETVRRRLESNTRMESSPDRSQLLSFLMNQGLGEATDVLLIDEDLCVACDNCEQACADTHQGISRLDRETGNTYASIHVPISCRHCEHPHCMKECPPDAIHRAPNGEVFIDDTCIGCGNCERNCPYDVIRMAVLPPEKPPLWQWLLFGRGHGPGEDRSQQKKAGKDAVKKAYKCDLCMDQKGGPACVRACPTGAALRVSPSQFSELIDRARVF